MLELLFGIYIGMNILAIFAFCIMWYEDGFQKGIERYLRLKTKNMFNVIVVYVIALPFTLLILVLKILIWMPFVKY